MLADQAEMVDLSLVTRDPAVGLFATSTLWSRAAALPEQLR